MVPLCSRSSTSSGLLPVALLVLAGCAAPLANTVQAHDAAPLQAQIDHETLSRDRAAVIEQLLQYNYSSRVAHVLDRSDLLVRLLADPLISVSAGAVRMQSRAQAREFFAAYFAAVDFLEWEDLRPPRVIMSASNDWATILVEKRVRAISRGEPGRHLASHLAWTETWQRSGEWQMTMIVSTDQPLPQDTTSVATRLQARDMLARARRALGGDSAVAMVSMLSYGATVRGPGGPFAVHVRSARDGRAYLRQELDERAWIEMGVALAGGWSATAGGRADSLSVLQRSFLAGHEVHLLILAPESRFHDPRARNPAAFRGASADVLEFSDQLGGSAIFFYDPATGLPLGFRLTNHRSDALSTIDVWLDDWRRVDALLLPHAIEFHDATGVYHYSVTDAAVGWIDDSAFRTVRPE